MNNLLLISAVVIILSIVCSKISDKIGIPSLLLFLGLGVLFGRQSIFKIPFNNFKVAQDICTAALIFIMFQGGFRTRWKTAKPVVSKAVMLSTFGVFFTAIIVALTQYFFIGPTTLVECLLIGSVVSSTDAASVFSVLKSKNLFLKENTTPLLELESGSNDPIAYMLTIIFIQVLKADVHVGNVILLVFTQFFVGILCSIVISAITIFAFKHFNIVESGLDSLFVIAMIILSYVLPTYLNGNGYLSTYIFGIVLGNSYLKSKIALVNFFNGITSIFELFIFFLLGLLAPQHFIPEIFLKSFILSISLLVIARPLAVFILLKPLKCSNDQILLVSFAGIRGASAIIFAIMAQVQCGAFLQFDLFNFVFYTVLISILIQGTFLSQIAKKLHMIDYEGNVYKTFSDYQEEKELQFIKLDIGETHSWKDKRVCDLNIPKDLLLVSLIRNSNTSIPNGRTVIKQDDELILAGQSFNEKSKTVLHQMAIDKDNDWIDKKVFEVSLPENQLITTIKRGNKTIIPNGRTEIKENDIVVILGK